MTTQSKLFGKLGNKELVTTQAALAIKIGALMIEKPKERTVELRSPGGRIMFKALNQGADVWLLMYSTAFYVEICKSNAA